MSQSDKVKGRRNVREQMGLSHSEGSTDGLTLTAGRGGELHICAQFEKREGMRTIKLFMS